jgi:hypothetical protein
LNERPGWANESYDQGSHCQTLSLRRPRPASAISREFHRRLQLCPSIEGSQRADALWGRLQMLGLDIAANSALNVILEPMEQ